MTYTVVLLHEKDGRYSAIAPALGVASWGHDVPEALRMVEEAIRLYVECLREHDEPVPPDATTFTIEMGDATEGLICKVRVEAPTDAHVV
jgi:predicted RNase H-like HicB family nuclease